MSRSSDRYAVVESSLGLPRVIVLILDNESRRVVHYVSKSNMVVLIANSFLEILDLHSFAFSRIMLKIENRDGENVLCQTGTY